MRESLEDGELRTAVLANYWINWIWYSVGNQAAAETGTRELLAEVEKGGNEKTAALLQCHLGQILMARRRLGEAESCLAEGLQRRTQLAMVDDQLDLRRIDGMYCYTTAQLALVYADIGSFARAHELMRHALDLVRRVGERATEASLLISAAILANYVGDWPGVKSVLEALHAVPDPSISSYVRNQADVLGGYAEFRLTGSADGLQRLRRGVVRHEESEAHLALCMCRALLADALLRDGENGQAVLVANRARAARDCGERLGDDVATYVLLRTSGASKTELKQRIDELRSEALALGSFRSVVLLDIAAGHAHLLADERELAAACADAAVAATKSLNMPGIQIEAERLWMQIRARG